MNSNYYLVIANAPKDTLYLETEVMVAHTCNYSTEENGERRITNISYTVRPYLKPSKLIFKKLLGRPIILRSITAGQNLMAKKFSE